MSVVVLLCGAAVILLLLLGVPWLSKQLRFEDGFRHGVQEAAKAYEPQMKTMERRLNHAIEQAEYSYQRGYLDGQKTLTLPAPQKVVLELGEGMELRQKPQPRTPKETK